MNIRTLPRQRGLALPVMLIVLMVMLMGSIYLMKASTTTTIATANLAYDAALSKATDKGLVDGAEWLTTTASANKDLLAADSGADGYVSTFDPTVAPSNPAFWAGSKTISFTDALNHTNRIEYVIHRMCLLTGAYDDGANACVQTTAAAGATGGTAVGSSLSSDGDQIGGPPQVHYVVTARMSGPRGGNVVNQAVVMIGA